MESKIDFRVYNIDGDGFHLMINALINSNTVNMLIDSGASRTVFNLSVSRWLNIEKVDNKGATGLGKVNIESFIGVLDIFRIRDIVKRDYTAAFMDLDHVNKEFKQIGIPNIDGILGNDILMAHAAIIDYGNRILTLK